jgi:hypothetical protein
MWDHLDTQQRKVVDVVAEHADLTGASSVSVVDYGGAVLSCFTRATRAIEHQHSGVEQGWPDTIAFAVAMAMQAMVGTPIDDGLHRVIDWVCSYEARLAGTELASNARRVMQQKLCLQLREIFGNPFAMPHFGSAAWFPQGNALPAWLQRIGEVPRALARDIQVTQGFHRLPILADALEDDGITHAGLLEHLRSDAIHQRGCWALDAVLGLN